MSAEDLYWRFYDEVWCPVMTARDLADTAAAGLLDLIAEHGDRLTPTELFDVRMLAGTLAWLSETLWTARTDEFADDLLAQDGKR